MGGRLIMQGQLFSLLKKHRNSILGLIIGYVLLLIAMLPFDNFLEKGIHRFNIRIFIYLAICLGWLFLWEQLRMSFPRREKDKIGMIISITAEKVKQTGRIRNDFVENIINLLKKHGLYELFQVVIMNELQSEIIAETLRKYVEKKEEYKKKDKYVQFKKAKEYRKYTKLSKRIKGHFYIWGSIKERKNIENTYIMGLDCLVMHTPINLKASERFSEEISTAFPKEISFYEKVELVGFSEASRFVLIGARYVIGIAALISKDVFVAYNLHKSLWDELRAQNVLPEPHMHMLKRLREIMFIELIIKSNYALYKEGDIEKAKSIMDEADRIESQTYPALTFYSIYSFKVERNAVKAMKYLRSARKKGKGDYTWLYNKAFLNMYTGKLKLGLEDYDGLSEISYENEERTVEECIIFNKEVLVKEPNKKQSKFILGYLYYIKQGNLPESLEVIEEFLGDIEGNATYEILRIRANTYREAIKREMGIDD
jgi:hypothetical protein